MDTHTTSFCGLSPPVYLTKSDFKVARTCGTKLYYRKLRYPSTLDDDDYLEFLADGGFMVEAIAKLLFPEGREIPFGATANAMAETSLALRAESTTLFEATLCSGQLLARVDILEKRGPDFRLIEVKAKSFDGNQGTGAFRGARGGISADWRPYLEDVTFQTLVLSRLFPDANVQPCLCLVDKSATCEADALFKHFLLCKQTIEGDSGPRDRTIVNFKGDVESLRQSRLVRIVDVSAEVDELLPDVTAAVDRFVRTLESHPPERITPLLGVHCKHCEFRVLQAGEPGSDGFRECWGRLAAPEDHLLDLYRVDLLGKNGKTAQDLIDNGRTALADVRLGDLRGTTGVRQKIQLEGTWKQKEFLDPTLSQLLKNCSYPFHFIDFEASRRAVPYHAGMRPYEQVLFQWSCHTISEPGARIQHRDWINVDDAYPNFEFARSLKDALGQIGTVFVWSHFEKTALNEIRQQLAQYGQSDPELDAWLARLTDDAGPLVDLCKLAKDHYFHPRMKGSLSIKDVLPAVWSSSSILRAHPWFSDYLCEKDGQILEPYETLADLAFGDDGLAEAVREGTAAMRTYQEMMYGVRKSDAAFREAQRQLLLNYCRLDTAAMVMIWLRWTGQV